MFLFQQFIFSFDIYRHHTNQVTGLRGNSQQAEPHIAVPTRESLTKEALFHISHICIEYTFNRIPLEIKFNTRYTAVYICPLLNEYKKTKQCATHGTVHLSTSSWNKKNNKQKNNQTKEQNNGSGSQIDTTFIQVGAIPSRFSMSMKAFISFRLHTERGNRVHAPPRHLHQLNERLYKRITTQCDVSGRHVTSC